MKKEYKKYGHIGIDALPEGTFPENWIVRHVSGDKYGDKHIREKLSPSQLNDLNASESLGAVFNFYIQSVNDDEMTMGVLIVSCMGHCVFLTIEADDFFIEYVENAN